MATDRQHCYVYTVLSTHGGPRKSQRIHSSQRITSLRKSGLDTTPIFPVARDIQAVEDPPVGGDLYCSVNSHKFATTIFFSCYIWWIFVNFHWNFGLRPPVSTTTYKHWTPSRQWLREIRGPWTPSLDKNITREFLLLPGLLG